MARPGPRSKLCRAGRHDWHHDGWCQRAGCLATRTDDLFGVRLDDPDDLGPGAGGQLDLFAADRERDPWGREQGGLFSNPPPPVEFVNWNNGHDHFTLYALTPEEAEELRRGILDRPRRTGTLGLVDYYVQEDGGRVQVLIQLIQVVKRARRMGLGTALWRELERRWPGAEFPRFTHTTEAGEALRRAVGHNPPGHPAVFDLGAPLGPQAMAMAAAVSRGELDAERAIRELEFVEPFAAGPQDASRFHILRRVAERNSGRAAFMASLKGRRSAHLRGARGEEVMIHPSVRPDATPGSWQVTRFGPGRPGEGMVPYGHHNEASMDAALAEAWRDYGPLDVIAANPPPPLARAAEVYVSPRARPLTEREAFVRQVSIDLKHGDPAAVEIAARAMAPLVPRGAVLVPVPSSKAGQVGGNEPLALRLAELTGGRALRLVERVAPVESSRERRRAGGQGLAPSAHAATMRAVGRPPLRRPVVLVDNVVVTGATMEGARRVLGLRRSEVLGVAYSSAEAPELARASQMRKRGRRAG